MTNTLPRLPACGLLLIIWRVEGLLWLLDWRWVPRLRPQPGFRNAKHLSATVLSVHYLPLSTHVWPTGPRPKSMGTVWYCKLLPFLYHFTNKSITAGRASILDWNVVHVDNPFHYARASTPKPGTMHSVCRQ
ncbi:hypothetical protein BJ166DRAFT_375410 [Pestalotiopsis sp. NC0098]|nr:hypothetical protein BJ166DRAFT_375410 [Pestalotiopsis sp. NC0098]